jgi:hypothetical protein
LIARASDPLVQEGQRRSGAEGGLAVGRNGAEDMPAAVALVFDFEPGRAGT